MDLNVVTSKLKRTTMRLRESVDEAHKKLAKRAAQGFQARLMRRRSAVNPELIKNAEIRALTDPS